MGPYTSILDPSSPKHQVRPCNPSPGSSCRFPDGIFPLQPEVLRFSKVAILGDVVIDWVVSIEPESPPYVPANPALNLITAGGVVSLNMATRAATENGGSNTARVKISFMSSCCSHPTCSECFDDAQMTTPGDRGTHINPDCMPVHPLTRKRNIFCCCYGINDFPMDYANAEDQLITGTSPRPRICTTNENALSTMNTPRTDTEAALRYNYRLARPSINTSDPNDWYKCSSNHGQQ